MNLPTKTSWTSQASRPLKSDGPLTGRSERQSRPGSTCEPLCYAARATPIGPAGAHPSLLAALPRRGGFGGAAPLRAASSSASKWAMRSSAQF